MCATCGCDADESVRLDGRPLPHAHGHGHDHAHGHDHGHEHVHDLDAPRGHVHHDRAPRTLRLEADLLAKNARIADRNRAWLLDRGILAYDVVGAPGAGKTALLERTVAALVPARPVAVIEGDQETDHDAARIRARGGRVVQLNTGTGCHLDAEMVRAALDVLAPAPETLLLVENVGNLVCPALFDLGERAKVVVLSVTEGEDKPIKYPHMFRAAEVLVLNKIDLLPHLSFDVDRCIAWARRVNPRLKVFRVSATRGDGMDEWLAWLSTPIGASGEPEVAR